MPNDAALNLLSANWFVTGPEEGTLNLFFDAPLDPASELAQTFTPKGTDLENPVQIGEGIVTGSTLTFFFQHSFSSGPTDVNVDYTVDSGSVESIFAEALNPFLDFPVEVF